MTPYRDLISNKHKLSPVWPHFTQIEVEKASNCYLYDTKGREYIDFTSGIGVANIGHNHPRVVTAIQAQAEKLIHGQATIVYHQPMLKLVEKLARVLPTSLDNFFFTNSGSEAVESAIKLARHATGKPNIIAFQGGYHGRTVGAMTLTTAKTIYRSNYQPLMPGVHIAPFPYSFRYKNMSPEMLSKWCIHELQHLLKTQTSPEETAAMIIEPVLGEGGYVVPPKHFLANLREICSQKGILLIFDEIQTGFGRTGELFGYEHFNVKPDILLIAKGLASGMPLSGLVANHKLMEHWKAGSHGGTYGGNALACAASIETLRVIHDESLLDNARKSGHHLISRLQSLSEDYSCIGEVRGLGLMVGCEFIDDKKLTRSSIATKIRKYCLDKGLILLTCGTEDHVIRWVPPLTVTIDQLEQALAIFEDALFEVTNREELYDSHS
ncbi:4-aminobutyrate aminotransferase [Marininema mesophilum]|uniref:(S)-3-amino-2-methylpropionate transaminase n=1 Tax=Marininema mesophilum TaxID=1048340 RepID=A0A1H3C4T1_9BACL|nr:aminotransferase class III-fold pyridoxal phosphate-dependent enzyme [Marininema mesophilum]SDX49163.1 4-aminobutyrate aminotransferase [Marininema mesophilum]